MTWSQNYDPFGNLVLSSCVAAVPVVVLLGLLAFWHVRAQLAAGAGLLTAMGIAVLVYGMPAGLVGMAAVNGAVFGLFPIGWIVLNAMFVYNLSVETGQFAVLQRQIASVSGDRRIQALLIAFSFGAFIEGAAGFGAPVAITGALMIGLGFKPLEAAKLALIGNTAPVAFGSIGIPVVTLAGITGLPLAELSGQVGRICAPVSLIVPAYLIAATEGFATMRRVLFPALLCGGSFAGVQFLVSNYLGAQLVDILSSLSAIFALLAYLVVKKSSSLDLPMKEVIHAWSPYLLLVACVLVWGYEPIAKMLNASAIKIEWPGLHNLALRMPPVMTKATPYAAVFNFNFLAASGTSCMLAAVLSAFVLGVKPAQFMKVIGESLLQLRMPTLTVCSVLGMAFLMNYSGATGTLGLAFAGTGVLFPFFSAMLGWLGVFLTGSDTSANALFGNLQVVTAGKLGLDLGVYGVPETFVLDRRGVIRFKQVGPLTPEAWRNDVKPLLAKLVAEPAP